MGIRPIVKRNEGEDQQDETGQNVDRFETEYRLDHFALFRSLRMLRSSNAN